LSAKLLGMWYGTDYGVVYGFPNFVFYWRSLCMVHVQEY